MITVMMTLLLVVSGLVLQGEDPINALDGVERSGDVIIVDDVPYGTVKNGSMHDRQVMDVAMPISQDSLLPVVVIIHGGGWAGGDKSDMRLFLEPLANAGCLAISPNYRLAPSDPAPAAIHDIKMLLDWLGKHAEALAIDPNRIALVGFSAGGHLSAIVGMTGDTGVLDAPGDSSQFEPVTVKCIASIGGPMDLSKPFAPRVEPLVKGWAGAVSGTRGPRSLYSPVRWVSPNDPPIMLIHGEQDDIVPLDNISGMKTQCDRHGVGCRIHIVDDGPHIPAPQTFAEPLADFLDDHLGSTISFGTQP